DRLGAELAPLTERLAVPLLPIVGKELLVYTIEALIDAGVRDLTVVTAARGAQTETSSLGDGRRWGMHIRYVLSRGEESPASLWPRLNRPTTEATLVLRGDLLRSPVIGAFLHQAQNQSGCLAAWAASDPRGSLLLVRPGCTDPGPQLESLRWDQPRPLPSTGCCQLADASLSCLQDLPAYHRACLDLVAGRFSGLAPSGQALALGLHAGRRANVQPRSLKQGVAYVGANSRVHPEAELLGEVVIGDEVLIDRAATIRDSVILPRTYIGELVEVRNAIVAGNHLMRVDTGAHLMISEAFLLGRLGAREGRAPGSVWDRLAGLVLLVLSLPLWPIALAAAALSGTGALIERETLIGNRRLDQRPGGAPRGEFAALRWGTPIPLLRHLPRLLAVISGDLRLFGVAPLTPSESYSRTEDWQQVRDQAPVGLLGPTQLNLSAAAPLEERLLSDAFYARKPSWQGDLGILWRGARMLVNGEAWRRSAAPGD
ncbi:MAG: NDP-sugar synthase, partial [Sphingobacteriia bacterium]|nr:NDP-sugar synthase [Sphingobacteriia bacterium]